MWSKSEPGRLVHVNDHCNCTKHGFASVNQPVMCVVCDICILTVQVTVGAALLSMALLLTLTM